MNYYLTECADPTVRMRHYKNSRVAVYARDQLNEVAGYEKYAVASDDEEIVVRLVRRNQFEGVNPFK